MSRADIALTAGRLRKEKKIHTIILIVAALVVATIPLGILIVALLTILRITTIPSLAALRVVIILIPRLVIPSPVLWKLLTRLERLGARLEGTCARAEGGLLRVVVQVHLLGLSRQVVVLCGRVILPRVEFRHDCVWEVVVWRPHRSCRGFVRRGGGRSRGL